MTTKRVLAPRLRALTVLVASLALGLAAVADEDDPLKIALEDYVADGWIYDDIDAAYAAAKRTGKPILASFR